MNLGVLRDLHELGESRSVVDSDVGQHLAVQVDVRLLQAADELGVGHAVHAGSRVDTGDPQGTEVALTQLTADIGVTQGAGDLLLRSAILLGLRAKVALRQLHNLPALLMGIDCRFNSCHGI